VSGKGCSKLPSGEYGPATEQAAGRALVAFDRMAASPM